MDRKTSRALSATGIGAALLALLRWLRRRRCCDPSVGAWDGAPTWSETGQMTDVEAFQSFVDSARPCWRHYPIAAALAVIGFDPRSDHLSPPATVEQGPSAGSGELDVTLVFEHEDDDSVAATRYRFTFVDEGFVGGTADRYRLLAGLREFRCQPGRGQTDWGPELCL